MIDPSMASLDVATIPRAPKRVVTTIEEWETFEARAWACASLRGLRLDFLRKDESARVRGILQNCGDRVGVVILRIVSLKRSAYAVRGVTFNEYRPR